MRLKFTKTKTTTTTTTTTTLRKLDTTAKRRGTTGSAEAQYLSGSSLTTCIIIVVVSCGSFFFATSTWLRVSWTRMLVILCERASKRRSNCCRFCVSLSLLLLPLTITNITKLLQRAQLTEWQQTMQTHLVEGHRPCSV